jgi:hypothetical protein
VRKTAFYFIQSATTGFTVSTFPYPSRVSLKEALAVLELCAGKLACTVLRGPGPSNGVWLLGVTLQDVHHPRRHENGQRLAGYVDYSEVGQKRRSGP